MQVNPRASLTNYDIALGYKKLEQTDSALFYNEKVITEYPKYAKAFNLRGDLYSSTQKYTVALADYSKAIALNPDNKFYYADRGDAYLQLNKPAEALKDFENACLLDKSYDYAIKRMIVTMKQGSFRKRFCKII